MISIIIPVYNVEKYIKESVDSVINQTASDFEIVLVDDGSTDNSGKICDEYGARDSRIKVVHKENGGLSSARNSGVEVATGDYVLFLDSDDYISSNYIQRMNEELQKNSYDMIVCYTLDFNDGEMPQLSKIEGKQRTELTPEQALENIYYQRLFDTNACGKLMRIDTIRKYPFVNGVLYEDFNNVHMFLDECEKILFLPETVYFYRQRNNSIMNSYFDERKFFLIEVAEKHLRYVQDKHPKIMDAAIRRYIYSNFHILGRIINKSEYEAKSKELRKNILNYKHSLLHNKNVGMKDKMAVRVLSVGMSPYRLFWNTFCKIKKKNV